jgi:hypothetical protein
MVITEGLFKGKAPLDWNSRISFFSRNDKGVLLPKNPVCSIRLIKDAGFSEDVKITFEL